jgi:hypothetical protein
MNPDGTTRGKPGGYSTLASFLHENPDIRMKLFGLDNGS